MTYTLIALFLATGQAYVEERGLSLLACAGRAAMVRHEIGPALATLEARIGKVKYLCIPEEHQL